MRDVRMYESDEPDELDDEASGEAYEAESWRRGEYLAPLVAYLRAHHYIALPILRDAAARAVASGEEPMLVHGNWLPMMRRGQRVVPPWLVEQCCAVIGRTVEEVMGAEWVRRFGADGRGGMEASPIGSPRIQRPWRYSSKRPRSASPDADSGTGTGTDADSGAHNAPAA